MTGGRDWPWAEVLALVLVLVAGAGARYWLSTVLPFDARELQLLRAAAHPEAGLRVPLIMIAGLGLFLLYLVVRRSAGWEVALAVLLLVQTSVTVQEHALRLRLSTLLVPPVLGLLVYWRASRPPWRAGPALRRAVLACGGAEVASLSSLRGCALSWPPGRSLRQQEAGLQHARRLGEAAFRLAGPDDWPGAGPRRTAVFDERGACLLVVPDGPAVAMARRVTGAAPAGGEVEGTR